MKLVTGAQIKTMDAIAGDTYGMPSLVLMENAGMAVLTWLLNHDAALDQRKIVIFVGKGNNGGDGLVLARQLFNRNFAVRVVLVCQPEELKADALTNYFTLLQQEMDFVVYTEHSSLTVVELCLLHADYLVDGIFGVGFQGELPPYLAKLMKLINQQTGKRLAIDIPSGVNATTGACAKEAIRADFTITFAAVKQGLCLLPAREFCGELYLANISMPNLILKYLNTELELITKNDMRKKLPARGLDSHKYSYGHVLVIGGAIGMEGAPFLAARAALQAGAGLVSLAVPDDLIAATSSLPELMVHRIKDANAYFTLANRDELLALAAAKDVLVLGCGMGRAPETGDLVNEILNDTQQTIVLDADGLFYLEQASESRKLIITPHPGEMARLLGWTTAEVQADRIAAIRLAAKLYQAVVVLKGAHSLIAAPEGKVYLNLTGNNGMATAGSGDLLAGIIGGLVAQNSSLLDSALLGVYLHGLAGDMATARHSVYGVTASRINEMLDSAFLAVQEDCGVSGSEFTRIY
ncbi:MAG: NAD(P)H-hydrate dehydratase [Clostridia bacterium]